MVWNTYGVVTCRKEPLGNVIAVDFSDTVKNRSLTMTDQMHFSVADVAEAGLLLCSRYQPPQSQSDGDATDAGVPGFIYFKPFASWGGATAAAGEWRLELPVFKPHLPASHFPIVADLAADPVKAARMIEDDAADSGAMDTSSAAESAVAAAVGDGWCAVATDRQLLRFFRTSGLQVGGEDGAVVVRTERWWWRFEFRI
jgi:hypothetical protein